MMTADRQTRGRILHYDDWPIADRASWETATRRGDPFEEAGPMAGWRPATLHSLGQSYGRWLAWNAESGLLDECDSPADRVCPDRVRRYIEALRKVNLDTTVHLSIHGLRRAIQAMVPDADWSWLKRAASHLRLNIKDRKDKRSRIRSSRDLHELGLRLMAEAEGYSTVPWKRASRYRDGLLIALLAARPLRLRNLAGLRIGTHLVEHSEGFGLHIPAEEVKTHTPLELPLPADLVAPLRHYLSVYRPVLLGANEDDHLWINKYGSPMAEQTIYKQVTKLTRAAFGVSINPHLFRDCLASSIAIEDPEHVHVASKLLGHSSIDTTTRHYNQATSLSAGRAVSANILNLRRGLVRDPYDDTGF
jgi:integrase/recombinase XerD